MTHYQCREWLRDDDTAAVMASIEEDGYAELRITDGSHTLDLVRMYTEDDPAQQQANLELVTRLLAVLMEFHAKYQDVVNKDTGTR